MRAGRFFLSVIVAAFSVWAVSSVVLAGGKGSAGRGDNKPPTSRIVEPVNGTVIPVSLWSYSITGQASDGRGSGVQYVEVSVDNGFSWARAADRSGDGSWSNWGYKWNLSFSGLYTLKSRAVDNSGNEESPRKGVQVRVTTIP